MNTTRGYAVTGAYGYTGKYITLALLKQGHKVITLTNNPDRSDPFEGRVPPFPLQFDDPNALIKSFEGIDTFFNTYWVRFDYGEKTFSKAVANTKILFQAALAAGVRRIVHVSISNPSLKSNLPYFSSKAELEQYLKNMGVSYAILRPTVIFGLEDILINNIAWLLRRFPVFTIPGDGKYCLQPIYVEDMAALAIQAGEMDGDVVWDAVGPEVYSFNELISTMTNILGRSPWLVHLPPAVALSLSQFISRIIGDVLLTRDELAGLMADLLISSEKPRGNKSLAEWLSENKRRVGINYASELARHYKT